MNVAENVAENLIIDLSDEASTLALGAQVARELQPGITVYLSGDLGAGKTTLVRGLIHSLKYQGRVKSPTYALVELYVVSKLNLYHFDFYRFRDPEEWHEAGFRDLFNQSNVCLVEWPEKANDLLPPPDLHIMLSVQQTANQDSRQANLSATTAHGLAIIRTLRSRQPIQSTQPLQSS